MPRRPNTRPTAIYWLIDMRPETLATWPNGRPFYCGKSVQVSARLGQHKRSRNATPTTLRVRICGEHLRIQIMETVLAGSDWCTREAHWVALVRHVNPKATNISNGGDGAPGMVHSAETRAKVGAAHLGKIVSKETRAKLRAAGIGKTLSSEHRAKVGAALRGKKRANAHLIGRTVSQKTREKIRTALLGKKHTAERNANRSTALRGRKLSAEIRARMCLAQQVRRAAESAHV